MPPQRQELAAEAKAARTYRDEIETLKVQVMRSNCMYMYMYMQLLAHVYTHVNWYVFSALVVCVCVCVCVSQGARVEKLEADVRKYRQKAEDTEYLRKRISVSCLLCLHLLSLQLF